ncbi:MAG: DUF4197 domain-containing protein [Methylocystaceae bacterium]|nr:DUF4197 domain-containing protein [Methylocystaceae bacterium]
MRLVTAFLTALFTLSLAPSAQASDLLNFFQKKVEEQISGTSQNGSALSSLSNSQIVEGLREALKVGTKRVVDQIGTTDGYNLDKAIHIPLPDQLQQAQKLLNKFGLSALADDVELRLNRAAEQAAPKAKDVIIKAITNMSLDDARAIYNGPKDAATQYFKKVSDSDLRKTISPIAENSLKDVGAIQAYDNLVGKYQSMPFVPDVKANLIDHTTTLAIDGIFHYLAQEEAAIRENPAKRTTEILKTVFGQ